MSSIPVYILGESGTGKSASLRNFKEGDVKVINVASKPLPFKNKLHSVNVDKYDDILAEIKSAKEPSIVVDDAQYIMANEFMRRASERGFDKFTEIAFHMWDIVNEVKDLAGDKIVYFLSHTDRDADGNEKVKTIGKLLDEKITLEGMFTIVLKTNVSDGQYSFLTQNSGKDTVKSPIGLFSSYAIDNDLKYVDEKIRNYYELGEFLSGDDIAKIDEDAKSVDLEPKGKKSRKRTATVATEQPETPIEDLQFKDGNEPAPVERKRKERIAEPEQTEETEKLPFTEATEDTPVRRRRRRA